jgi:hypothetical protein
MKTTIAAAVLTGAALVLGAVTASAASLVSAKKLEVDVDEAKVEAERAALWEKIGGWCAISEWHPAIAKCEASKEGETEFRTLTLKDGGVIKERLLERGNATYKYEIIESPLPVKNYSAQFSVTPDDDDLDEINVLWSATYDANGKEDKEARKVIDGIFKDGMDSIKAKYADGDGKKDDGKKDDDDDKK